MEEVNHVEANSVQINGTAPHEDNTPNGTHEDKKLIEKSEKSTEEPSTKAEAAPAPVQKPKLSNVELANLSKELDKLSKYNLKDIVVQILKSFPETESPVREQVKVLSAPRTPRQATPRKTPVSTPRATNNNNNTQSSPSRPSTSRSTASSNPNLFTAGPTAKRVTVFLAGQELKNGQVILINQGRTFQQFVDDVTNKFRFINNNIKIYSYPAANLIQNIEELDSGMQLLAALPNQKPTIQTAPSSPRKTTSSPAKPNPTASPAKTNAPPPVSVAPRRSDPGPISNRNNNNNAGSAPKRVYQPKTPTKQSSEPKETTTKALTPSSSAEKKVMVRGPVQREVVTNPQKNVSVKDLIGAAKNSPPAKSGWIVPQKNQVQPTQPEQTQQSEVPANNNNSSTDVAPAHPVESRSEPVQEVLPVQQKVEQPVAPAQPIAPAQPAVSVQPALVQPEAPAVPAQSAPVQPAVSVQPALVQPEAPAEVKQTAVSAQAAETKPEPAAPTVSIVQQKVEQPAAPVQQEVPPQREVEQPEESVPVPDSPSKVEAPRAAVVVTSPEPKSDKQIALDLDSKLLEVMNRRRMEQQQKQSS